MPTQRKRCTSGSREPFYLDIPTVMQHKEKKNGFRLCMSCIMVGVGIWSLFAILLVNSMPYIIEAYVGKWEVEITDFDFGISPVWIFDPPRDFQHAPPGTDKCLPRVQNIGRKLVIKVTLGAAFSVLVLKIRDYYLTTRVLYHPHDGTPTGNFDRRCAGLISEYSTDGLGQVTIDPMLLLGTGRRVQFQTKRIGGSPASMQPDTTKDSIAIENTTTGAGTAKSLSGWTKKFSETISREPFMNFLNTGEPGHVWSAGLQSTTIATFREYITTHAKPGSQRDSEPCNWDECALYACGYCEVIEGTTYCPDTKITDAGDGAILESEIQDFCVLNPESKNAEFSSHSCREALKLGPGEVPPAIKYANLTNDDSAFSGENPMVMESVAAKPGESLLYKIPTTTKGHVMCSGIVFHFVPEKSSTPNDAFSTPMSSLFPIISILFIMNLVC